MDWTFQDSFSFSCLFPDKYVSMEFVTTVLRQKTVLTATAADENSAPARLSSNQIVSSTTNVFLIKAQDGDTHFLSGKNEY